MFGSCRNIHPSVAARLCLVAVAGLGPLAGSCSDQAVAVRPRPQAVAVVNDEPISIDSFQSTYDELKGAGRGYFGNKDKARKIKQELLEHLIDEKLLLQEARHRGLVLDPKLLEQSVQLPFEQYPPGEAERQLLARGKSLESYRHDTRRTLLIFKLLKQEVVDRVAVSSQEVTKYYQQHPQVRQQAEMVRVRQIVTRTKEEAEQLRKRLKRGESFEQLARQYSLGPEASRGGDLGFFARGTMPPAIEESCFSLWRPKQISQVITSPYGYHIFQLLERRPARELSPEEAAPRIEKTILARKVREAEAYFLRKLREGASIERNLELLERIH